MPGHTRLVAFSSLGGLVDWFCLVLFPAVLCRVSRLQVHTHLPTHMCTHTHSWQVRTYCLCNPRVQVRKSVLRSQNQNWLVVHHKYPLTVHQWGHKPSFFVLRGPIDRTSSWVHLSILFFLFPVKFMWFKIHFKLVDKWDLRWFSTFNYHRKCWNFAQIHAWGLWLIFLKKKKKEKEEEVEEEKGDGKEKRKRKKPTLNGTWILIFPKPISKAPQAHPGLV